MTRICFIIKVVYLNDISFILMTIKFNQWDYQEKLGADHEKVQRVRLLANRVNAHAQLGRKTKRLVMTPKPLVDKHNAESGNRKLKYVRLIEKKSLRLTVTLTY